MKPREWNITSLPENDDGPSVSIFGPNADHVAVVEKSAYDYYEDHAEMFKAEWEKTKDKLDKAIEALKEVQTRSAHMESKHAGKINRYVTEFLRKLGEV